MKVYLLKLRSRTFDLNRSRHGRLRTLNRHLESSGDFDRRLHFRSCGHVVRGNNLAKPLSQPGI